MSTRDLQFIEPVTTKGEVPQHRRRITDRNLKAQRFLYEVAEVTYDPDLDINWDAPLSSDLVWLPEDRTSLYGTSAWDDLSVAQRKQLADREFVAIINASVYWRSMQSMVYFRDLLEKTNLVNDYARFTLTSINDEARNATMLTRLINMTGIAPYRPSPRLQRLTKFTNLLPAGPSREGIRLLVHEMTVAILHQFAADLRVHTHVRQVALYHVLASQRHLEMARDELLASVERRGRVRNAIHRWALALATTRIYRVAVDRRIYGEVGLNPEATAELVYEGPTYRANLDAATSSFRAFAYDNGIFRGPIANRILKQNGLGRPHA